MPKATEESVYETGSRAFALVFHDNYVSVHYAEIIAKARDLVGKLIYFMRISPTDSMKQSLPKVIHVSSRFVSSNIGAILEEAASQLSKEEFTLQNEFDALQEELKNVQPSITVADQKVSDMQETADGLKRIGELKASLNKAFRELGKSTPEQKNSV